MNDLQFSQEKTKIEKKIDFYSKHKLKKKEKVKLNNKLDEQ